jgi:hypothetical protein
MKNAPVGTAIKFEDVDIDADGAISLEETQGYLKTVTDMAVIKSVYAPVAAPVALTVKPVVKAAPAVIYPPGILKPEDRKCTTCESLATLIKKKAVEDSKK